MSSIEDLREVRIQKLNKLQSLGRVVFPIECNTTKTIGAVLEAWGEDSAPSGIETLSGRVMAIRGQGALIFIDLFDGTGNLQGLLRKGDCDDAERELFAETVDVGDFVSVTGTFFVSQRGEKTILVSAWKMLSKSLRPMPEKWAGLQDVEEKMRKRYLDILTDKDVRRKFEIRVATVSAIRGVLQDAGYLEVETPMFQPLYGGASAMPFTTHYNALETDFYLRISPELYLKRLLIAGFPKVFELNRNFRNEGIDVTHSPEFTMLEFYSAYETAKSQMAFVEEMLRSVVNKVFKSGTIKHEGVEINFDNKFSVVSYFDLFSTYADLKDIGSLSIEQLTEEAKSRGVKVEAGDAIPKIMDNIYKKHCRPKLVQPTFIIDYPAEYLPLAKRSEENPDFVDAFQLVIAGTELVKAFSELNDPLDQRKRFEDQEKSKKLGDKEAQSLDEDYLEAMEHGMPPAGGVGIGIDRLLMLLTDSHNIRDIILFPTLKPKN